jgi:tetratricopeptide (TPR) repeat protein
VLASGCAQNKPVTPDGSKPNEYSAYLYSAGNVLQLNNDYAGAEAVYRLALRYDKHSQEIQKALFTSVLSRTYIREVPLAYFAGFVDSLIVNKDMDKLMLERSYDLYIQYQDNQRAKSILDVYLKKYATARAYTSLFYLEQTLYNRSRVELLDKAFKLAGEDAAFMNSLGQLFLAFNVAKAEKVWLTALKYDTTSQAAINLWDLYSRQANEQKLHKLWNTFDLPKDKDKLVEVLSHSVSTSNFEALVTLSDKILQTNEPSLMINLLLASTFTNNTEVYAKTSTKLDELTLNSQESQFRHFLTALYSLQNNKPAESLIALALVDGKKALEDILTGYRSLILSREPAMNETSLIKIKDFLKQVINPATEQQLQTPIKEYLLAYIDSLGMDNIPELSDSLSLSCVMSFYNQNRRTYDTYIWLAQYYHKTKQDSLQKDIIKEALDDFAEDASLLNWLGYSYVLDNENLDEAESLIRRALQLSPDNPFYLDSLAWLYYTKGDFQTALKLMAIPSRLEKMPSEIAWHIGEIYLALGDKDNALYYLELAVQINDDPIYVEKAKKTLEGIK